MSGFNWKGGWHPEGKGGNKKESWRGDFKGVNQVAGWLGKGKDGSSSEEREAHVSQPLTALRDRMSLANYSGFWYITSRVLTIR